MVGNGSNELFGDVDEPVEFNFTNIFINKPKYHLGLLIIIPLITVIGNALVVMSVWREKSLRSVTNYFIVSLAISDFIVAAFVMPFAVYIEINNQKFLLGNFVCTLYILMDVCASTASILNLLMISIDRFFAIMRPIYYSREGRSIKRGLIMLTIVWTTSFIIALPSVTLNRVKLEEYDYTCQFNSPTYIIASSIGSFWIPCCIMTVLYSIILKRLYDREQQKKKERAKRQRRPYSVIGNDALLGHVRRAMDMGRRLGETAGETTTYDSTTSSTDSSWNSDDDNDEMLRRRPSPNNRHLHDERRASKSKQRDQQARQLLLDTQYDPTPPSTNKAVEQNANLLKNETSTCTGIDPSELMNSDSTASMSNNNQNSYITRSDPSTILPPLSMENDLVKPNDYYKMINITEVPPPVDEINLDQEVEFHTAEPSPALAHKMRVAESNTLNEISASLMLEGPIEGFDDDERASELTPTPETSPLKADRRQSLTAQADSIDEDTIRCLSLNEQSVHLSFGHDDTLFTDVPYIDNHVASRQSSLRAKSAPMLRLGSLEDFAGSVEHTPCESFKLPNTRIIHATPVGSIKGTAPGSESPQTKPLNHSQPIISPSPSIAPYNKVQPMPTSALGTTTDLTDDSTSTRKVSLMPPQLSSDSTPNSRLTSIADATRLRAGSISAQMQRAQQAIWGRVSSLVENRVRLTTLKSRKDMPNGQTKMEKKESRQIRKERKATHTLAVVIGVFLFCWIPFFSCHTSNAVAIVLYDDPNFIPAWLFYTVTWLGYLNSLMNPIIYTTFNPEYRRAFRSILTCGKQGQPAARRRARRT